MGWFDSITAPFVSLEHSIEEGGKHMVRVVKQHPVESAIAAASLIAGGAAIVATGGLATPFVAEAETVEFGALTAATIEESAALDFAAVPLIEEEAAAAVIPEAVVVAEETTVTAANTVVNSIRASLTELAETAQTQFANANEFISSIESRITSNPIVRGLSTIKKSAVASAAMTIVMGFDFIKDARDLLNSKDEKVSTPEEPKPKKDDNANKIKDLLNKVQDIKDKLSKSGIQIDAMKRKELEDKLKSHQQLLEKAKEFKTLLLDEQNKEQHLAQKNEQLQEELKEDEAEIRQQQQNMIRMNTEIENIKELVGESFLRPLDFNEIKLLINSLDNKDEIVSFLARNRKDFEKLSKNQQTEIINIAKTKF